MLPEDKYFQTRDEKKIWQRYCGFLDLSIEDFMQIQRRLLMEQITLVSESVLGKKIMGGKRPQSVEEFRRLVPLTTYEDYEPYLSQQQEEVLTEKPYYWCHSAGRGGFFKWVPYTQRGFEVFAKRAIGANILAAAKAKGDTNFRPGARMLLLMPPKPYTSGSGVYYLSKRFSMRLIPSAAEIEELEFSERISIGFKIALSSGVDVIFSLASVLVKAGESMSERAQGMRFSMSMLKPPVLIRLVMAMIRSRMERRSVLPRDLWKAKSILTGGPDVGIYRDKITYYWGQVPYEIYGATEAFPLAIQNWNRKWSTFIPDIAFLEFIPEEEWLKTLEDSGYQPATVLFDEVKVGESYEVVITHFYGMPFLRYRMKDLVTFVSMRDEETGMELPQITFKGRVDDAVNLGGLTRLDEKTILEAIISSGLKCEGWSARKEYDEDISFLRLYMELRDGMEVDDIERLIDQQLKIIDVDYRDVESMLGIQPVRVTIVSPGTFQRYYEEKRKEGADLAHLKPPSMNASDTIIERLLQFSQEVLEAL